MRSRFFCRRSAMAAAFFKAIIPSRWATFWRGPKTSISATIELIIKQIVIARILIVLLLCWGWLVGCAEAKERERERKIEWLDKWMMMNLHLKEEMNEWMNGRKESRLNKLFKKKKKIQKIALELFNLKIKKKLSRMNSKIAVKREIYKIREK